MKEIYFNLERYFEKLVSFATTILGNSITFILACILVFFWWSTSILNTMVWNGATWNAQASGGGGGMPSNGSVEIDFGPTPQDMARVTVEFGLVTATSMILLTLDSVGTSDHSSDEHMVEEIHLRSDNIVVGSTFDIVAVCGDKFGLTGLWAVRWALIG